MNFPRKSVNKAARVHAALTLATASLFAIPCLGTVSVYALSDIRLPTYALYAAGYAGVMGLCFAVAALVCLAFVALTE